MNDELDPVTLKFKPQLNYCIKHEKINKRDNFLKKSFKVFSMQKNQIIEAKRRNRNGTCNIHDLTYNCDQCVPEYTSLRKTSRKQDQYYFKQSFRLFKYNILMCLVIFLSLLFISFILEDFKK